MAYNFGDRGNSCMSGAAPAISVLVVTSGRSRLLDECLTRVRVQADEIGAELEKFLARRRNRDADDH